MVGPHKTVQHTVRTPSADVCAISQESAPAGRNENLALDTGLGTAFNAVSNAKAHYLSAGLDFKN